MEEWKKGSFSEEHFSYMVSDPKLNQSIDRKTHKVEWKNSVKPKKKKILSCNLTIKTIQRIFNKIKTNLNETIKLYNYNFTIFEQEQF